MRILGYQRADGRMGIRNHVAVIYTVECAKVVAQKIAIQFPGTQVFGRRTGCYWSGPIFDKLVALGCHPNVGAVVVVGLGCEYIEAPKVAAQIAESGKPVEAIVITQAGGTLKSVDYGARVISNMLEEVDCTPRAPMKESDLVVAVDCAGSDATSGLASNPAVGVAADLLVQAGGTVYFFNVRDELLGLGDTLASRAVNRQVEKKLRRLCPEEGAPQPSLGNVLGGITTYREKAVGALTKGGTSPVKGVVNGFVRPREPGLYLQLMVEGSNEAESDPQCAMQMAAAGAHVVVETTGVGTVTGGVVAPVIKVCANPKTCSLLADDLDVDASPIITGEKEIQDLGVQIYAEMLSVAAGKRTKAEVLGHFED